MAWFKRKHVSYPLLQRKLTEAQEKDEDAVFHGVCTNCLYLKGNNHGAGMQWCMGCSWAHFGPTNANGFPDRHFEKLTGAMPEDYD